MQININRLCFACINALYVIWKACGTEDYCIYNISGPFSLSKLEALTPNHNEKKKMFPYIF